MGMRDYNRPTRPILKPMDGKCDVCPICGSFCEPLDQENYECKRCNQKRIANQNTQHPVSET